MSFSLPAPHVGASPEVIKHAYRQHVAECPKDRPTDPNIVLVCPCGRSGVLVCESCSRPVFVVAVPGYPLCACGRQVLDMSTPDWFAAQPGVTS